MKRRKTWAWLLVAALLLPLAAWTGQLPARADTSALDPYVMGILFQYKPDGAGGWQTVYSKEPSGTEIDNTASTTIKVSDPVKLTYYFDFPASQVADGNVFTMQLPDTFAIPLAINRPLEDYDNPGNYWGDMSVSTSGLVTVTMNAYAQTEYAATGFGGNIFLEAGLDENEAGTGGSKPITFFVQGQAININVDIDVPVTPAVPPTIQKSGTIAADGEITWRVVVTAPQPAATTDVVIVDTLGAGQNYVPGSLTVGGTPVADADAAVAIVPALNPIDGGGSISYTLSAAQLNAGATLEFKTTPVDSAYANTHGTTANIDNGVSMNYLGQPYTHSNHVTVTSDWIRKEGTYNATTKKIDWMVTVNGSQRAIEGASVTDTLASGLRLSGPVTLNSMPLQEGVNAGLGTLTTVRQAPGAAITLLDSLTFNFETISDTQVLRFSTDVVDPDAYNSNSPLSYANSAVLTSTSGPGGTAATDTGIPVATSVISKSGKGYNAATRELSWEIIVNSNNISITDALVTDIITPGQTFVENSLRVNGSVPPSGFNYVEQTKTWTYAFSGTISTPQTITFKTTVDDVNVWANNVTIQGNAANGYTNTASLTGTGVRPSSSTGRQTVDSEVISKSGASYNYLTRVVTWKIKVNDNAMPIPGAYLIDKIVNGLEFLPGSFKVSYTTNTPAAFVPVLDAQVYTPLTGDANYSGQLGYTFDDPITAPVYIEYQTLLTDLTVFNNNRQPAFSNSATLTNTLPGSPLVTATDSVTVKNTIVDKKAIYVSGQDVIDWEVLINSNKLDIQGGTLVDELPEGLSLLTGSVKLYRLELTASGDLINPVEIDLTQCRVRYNGVTRRFEFDMPATITDPYRLTFSTAVNVSGRTYSNTISFAGSGYSGNGTITSNRVSFSEGGGGSSTRLANLQVTKTLADHTTPVEGVIFGVYDSYDNEVARLTTGPDGRVTFTRLERNADYTIKEVYAPAGYEITEGERSITLDGAGGVNAIAWTNELVNGAIELMKVDDTDRLVQGAVFGLYSPTDTAYAAPIATATSNSFGIVRFTNVAPGTYNIREISAPRGFELSTQVATAIVPIGENLTPVQATPYRIVNDIALLPGHGALEFYKVDPAGRAIAGAKFAIVAPNGFVVKTATSEASGLVSFWDIPAGIYTVKEVEVPVAYRLSSFTFDVTITDGRVTEGPYKFFVNEVDDDPYYPPVTPPVTTVPTPTPKPGVTPTPRPGVTTPVPGVTTPAPGVTTPVPGVTTPAPGVTTPVPGVTTPAPGVTTPVPGVTTPAPGVTTPAPGVTTPVPGVTATPTAGSITPVPAGETPVPGTLTTPLPGSATATPAPSTKPTLPQAGGAIDALAILIAGGVLVALGGGIALAQKARRR